jgi:tryptophan synthase beta subunit
MAAKEFGLKCKVFMGAKDIKRQKPNVDAMKKMAQKLYLFFLEAKHWLMLLVNV